MTLSGVVDAVCVSPIDAKQILFDLKILSMEADYATDVPTLIFRFSPRIAAYSISALFLGWC